VPCAVQLLSCVADLQNLDTTEFTPSDKIVHNALSLLGEALHSLLEPFINHKLSISEQLIHLVKCAHILCTLYLKHGTSFMPNQLYGDLQCMVKNAVFYVAKTQELDPNLRVFICLLSDDVLETLFGRICMIGGHSPNVEILKMRNRIRSALNLNDIFSREPSWERKPEWLKLLRIRDFDHLRLGDRHGNLVAKFCNVENCWKDGACKATTALCLYGGVATDFGVIFSKDGFDLMRPRGGQYPGIAKDLDRSMLDICSPADGDASGTVEIQPNLPSDESDQAHAISMSLHPETNCPAKATNHSVYMTLSADGCAQHKATVLREGFDPITRMPLTVFFVYRVSPLVETVGIEKVA
jgi:hypothetical protein